MGSCGRPGKNHLVPSGRDPCPIRRLVLIRQRPAGRLARLNGRAAIPITAAGPAPLRLAEGKPLAPGARPPAVGRKIVAYCSGSGEAS
jgi:hypothetical protein